MGPLVLVVQVPSRRLLRPLLPYKTHYVDLHACPVKRVNERRASWSATASTQSTGTLRHNMNVDSSSPRWKIFCCEKWRRPNGRFKGAFPRIRNARQPAAKSRSAYVSKHRTHIAFDDDRVNTGDLRGAVVKSSSRGRIPANTQHGAARRRIPLGSRL